MKLHVELPAPDDLPCELCEQPFVDCETVVMRFKLHPDVFNRDATKPKPDPMQLNWAPPGMAIYFAHPECVGA